MNKIVLEHYPVEKLPEDVRAVLGDARAVRLVIEPETQDAIGNEARYQQLLSDMANWTLDDTGRGSVERIRALRDEWDD